ncbi:hypothetical protein ACWDSJ_21485 [Nocardia sp. NPDC003482]
MSAHPLTDTLGAPLPEEFTRLSDTELGELDRLLRAARTRRAKHLAEAVDSSMRYVPRLLRPTLRKALGL